MEVKTGEIPGKSDLVAEDLSNVVDVGTEILAADTVDNYDNYVKSLVNQMLKCIKISYN